MAKPLTRQPELFDDRTQREFGKGGGSNIQRRRAILRKMRRRQRRVQLKKISQWEIKDDGGSYFDNFVDGQGR